MEKMDLAGGWLKKAYYGLVQGENFLGHFLLLIIRLYWGSLLMIAGFGKFTNIQGVSQFFGSLGIPLPLFSALLVATVELVGGASLFVGLFSRIFSILLGVVFIVAYSTAHTEALVSIFVNPKLFLTEEPFLFLYASLIVLCFGAGMFSFDCWIERKAYGKKL